MAVINLNGESFQTEVVEQQGIWLIDFWASWCAPCRMLSPIVDEVAEGLQGIKIGKVNVDEEQALAMQFRVMSIPTLVVMKDGKEVKRSTGVISKDEIIALIDNV